MKILGWIVIGFLLIVILLMIMPDNSTPGKINQDSKANEAALIEIMKEEKIKDAVITSAGVLYAAVIDDGTRRDGYAEYLCALIKEKRINVSRVKIIKVGSSKDPKRDNAYGILLGESWCK